MHCHQSLWKEGTPLMADKSGYAGLSQLARAYVGGLLEHAPALLAFCAPTTNSYRRLVPGYEAPVNLVYSQRNRSACIRIPMYSDSPKAKRIEFRCPDAAANPYLAFSAMLMAGIDGIERGLDPGAPADYDLFEDADATCRRFPARSPRRSTRSRRPRVPDRRRRVQRRADPDLDRLQARERGRPGAPAPAPGRVRPLLRRVIVTASALQVDELTAGDWPAVSAVYADGIATRNATFETTVPSWSEWERAHMDDYRLVGRVDGEVVGWAALSRVSDRQCYRGVAEDSVYVRNGHHGQGVGRALLSALVSRAEAAGVWTIQAGVFPENIASVKLHVACGFRVVGVRERIGQLDGAWRDVVLLERRSKEIA
jgi:L-amino acid N-acyltransferase YncA